MKIAGRRKQQQALRVISPHGSCIWPTPGKTIANFPIFPGPVGKWAQKKPRLSGFSAPYADTLTAPMRICQGVEQ